MKRGVSGTITALKTRRRPLLLAIVARCILTLRKVAVPMRTSSEDFTKKNMQGGGMPVEIARSLWPRLVELWIFAAIVVFFLVRVLGSRTAQQLLNSVRHHHLP